MVPLLPLDLHRESPALVSEPVGGRALTRGQYNKWMFSPDHLAFHFPLFTTSLHMLVQFSLASAVLFFLPHFRPRHDSITNPNNERRREAVAGNGKPLMTGYFYLTRITPCGTATGLDIGLGNMSLKFITLTFLSASLSIPAALLEDAKCLETTC